MSAVANTQEQQAEALKTLHRAAQDQADHTQRLRRSLESMLVEIAIGAGELDIEVENTPVAGRKRHVVSSRRLSGTDGLTIAVGLPATPVMPSNPGRLGGQIVNSGSNPVTLYLAPAGQVIAGATPAIWLAGGGGFWDLVFGKSVYAGPISASAGAGGTSTLVIAVA